ncbi:hypothetical protein WICANDRAFT_92448, partial [Wickerhamomyces anomalus NRRL Y-366-8]
LSIISYEDPVVPAECAPLRLAPFEKKYCEAHDQIAGFHGSKRYNFSVFLKYRCL